MTKEQGPEIKAKEAPTPGNGRVKRTRELRLLASRHVQRKVGHRVRPGR